MIDLGDPARPVRAAGGMLCRLLGIFFLLGCCASASAQDAASVEVEPADYCTPRFCLHTDLPKEDAEKLLKRLDCTLKRTSRFFGLPPRDSIEAFVVDRLDHWPSESFTHPAARLLIGGVGGGTIAKGEDFTSTSPRLTTVFAAATPSVPEHEIVHAYCLQTFGMLGPTWFKEGIAEMLACEAQECKPVQCSAEVTDYLRSEAPRTLAEITTVTDEFTAPLAASMVTMLERHEASERLGAVASMDDWREEQTEVVKTARLSYHWCWSACHFLNQHPGYNARFRMLGRGYVSGQDVDFDAMYAPVRDQLDFEYRFFLERITAGYRVDLCAWDWQDPTAGRNAKRPASIKVLAGRGYQPSGFTVQAGDHVCYDAKGEWRLCDDGAPVTADGNSEGEGRLEAILLNEMTLSEPIELGQKGKFTAAGDGRVYLRCRDGWGELANNRGLIRVSLRKSTSP